MGAYVSRQKDTGRSLTLIGVNQRVRQALQVTHVEQFFKFEDAAGDSIRLRLLLKLQSRQWLG